VTLEAALGARIEGEVAFDAGARALYATDSSNYRQVPVGVVWPRSADDIVETVRLCREHHVPILPRGAGTSLAGQCCNVAVVIDSSRHCNKLIAIDADHRTARVQPGLVLDDLQHAAAPYGLMYGPDPATHAWCTFGGMIGNNSCGVHSIVGGLTADNVYELDVLTSDGARLRVGRTITPYVGPGSSQYVGSGFSRPDWSARAAQIETALRILRDKYADEIRARYPQIPRRVSGYELDALLPERGFDIVRSLIGSEGTCVTILEATVRLIEAPRARSLLVLGFRDVFAAADSVMDVLATKPIGLEGLDEVIVRNLKAKALLERELTLLPEGDAWLLVEFAGANAADAKELAQAASSRLGRHTRAVSASVVTDPRDMHAVWTVRESALGATAFVPGEPLTWEGWEDAGVPPERLGAYLRDYHHLMGRFGYRGALYGHFGQGCVHTRTIFDLRTPAGIERFRAFVGEAADLVVSYGGSLSGEHGDGQSRAELLPKMFGPALVEAFREFKAIWDPEGLMNPGKVVDAYRITENLRLPGYRPEPVNTYFSLSVEGGMADAALRCAGVGKCRKTSTATMCPSYMVTREERHSTRGRARLLFEMMRTETLTDGWQSEAVREALDLCLACKACKHECPVTVDMATYKAEFLAHYHETTRRPLRAHLFGRIDRWASLAAVMPRLTNAIAGLRPIMTRAQAALGIAPERRLPPFAHVTFQNRARRRPRLDAAESVVLWPDTFTNYFHPEVGHAAVELLEALGYSVTVPTGHVCCGRPLYDFGFLDAAKAYLDRVFNVLASPLRIGTPIVVLEPSCFAVFRDEAVNLFPHRSDAKALSRQTTLLDQFIHPHAKEGRLGTLRRRAIVHGHCHQKALATMEHTMAALASIGADATLLDSGCCGMAGAFGFDRDHYDVSIQVGERVLLPAVRNASAETLLIADGFSCREQIAQVTGRRAQHLAEVVHLALTASRGAGHHPELEERSA
jgi:FAD/FMN-containing dehydrogenase/Fe-S oxidoreductase